MPFSVTHPLAYYGALSAAMSACLYLFVSTARNMDGLRKCLERRIGEMERETGLLGAQIASVETRLGEWAGRTKDVEETVSGLSAVRRASALSTGVDSNQRTQVLRMARRGEGAERIAAELRVPKNEVDLLLKVQRAVVRAF